MGVCLRDFRLDDDGGHLYTYLYLYRYMYTYNVNVYVGVCLRDIRLDDDGETCCVSKSTCTL